MVTYLGGSILITIFALGGSIVSYNLHFTFNVGTAALQRSVLRQKINYGHYDEGAKEFLKWIYAGGRKIMGLVRRRKLESDLFSSYRILDKSLL